MHSVPFTFCWLLEARVGVGAWIMQGSGCPPERLPQAAGVQWGAEPAYLVRWPRCSAGAWNMHLFSQGCWACLASRCCLWPALTSTSCSDSQLST